MVAGAGRIGADWGGETPTKAVEPGANPAKTDAKRDWGRFIIGPIAPLKALRA